MIRSANAARREERERAERRAPAAAATSASPAAIRRAMPLVGADQPQRGEPPVAILAAGPHRRADEHADRQQQRDERDHHQQREDRVQRATERS